MRPRSFDPGRLPLRQAPYVDQVCVSTTRLISLGSDVENIQHSTCVWIYWSKETWADPRTSTVLDEESCRRFSCICASEIRTYLISPKILLLNLLLPSTVTCGSEIAAKFLRICPHIYSFQSSITLFLKSPEYLVDILSCLLTLLATAGGRSDLSCGSEVAGNIFANWHQEIDTWSQACRVITTKKIWVIIT